MKNRSELRTIYNFGLVRLAEKAGHWYIMCRNRKTEISKRSAYGVINCIHWGAWWWEEVTPTEMAAIRAMMPAELGI